jgi:hypothetical protein
MITMIDEIYDRGYQAGRAELHDGIDRLFRKLRDALAPALLAVHHFEWDAPWQATAKPKH